MEYSAQKAAGILKQTHPKPLSEIITQEQLSKIPINNKLGENCFGQMTTQLRKQGKNLLKLSLPTRKSLPLMTFIKKLMFWLHTKLLSAFNHQKNLQSQV